MITGAMQVVTDQRPMLANIGAFVDAATIAKLAAGLVVAVALHLALRRSKSPFVMPGVLLAAFAATYLSLLLIGASSVSANRRLDVPSAARRRLISPWQPGTLQHFSWTSLPALTGDLLAVMFVTVITFCSTRPASRLRPAPMPTLIAI